jgi:hypothetical protein
MKLEFPLEKKFPLGSGFGPRGALAGGRIKAHNHKGQDIAAPTGTKVKSVDDGVVVRSTPPGQSGGYGNFIVVKHKDFYSAYGHLSKREVNKGDTVKKGQLIGLVGSTGQSTGPHLHFEIRKTENGSQIDPKPYLTGSELSSTILGKETDDEKPDDENDDKKTVDPVDPVDPEEPEDYGIMGQLLKMVGFKENYTIEGQHNIMEDINRIKQLLK